MKIKGREQNNPSATFGFVDLDVAKATVLSSLRSPASATGGKIWPVNPVGQVIRVSFYRRWTSTFQG
jgi:hypothetical protein